jgi:DNA-binding MarR family transcriptional regulator
MPPWQTVLRSLAAPLSVEPIGDADVVVRVGDKRGARFHAVDVRALTLGVAERDVLPIARASKLPIMVTYERSSPDARAMLREAGVSYAGRDGRLLLQAPPLFVERDRPKPTPTPERDTERNPFATRSSRVARWLLLHPNGSFATSELAALVDLSVPAVSRVLTALEGLALISRTRPADDARGRVVSLRRPRDLLEAWLPVWQRRRLRRQVWDVGASDPADAINLLRSARRENTKTAFALGGLAGAATVSRTVEPNSVLVWIDPAAIPDLERELFPQPARQDRGTLRITATPDPWTLTLATTDDGVPIADPVQLWLDCASEGERALEAAEAIARTMHW